MRYKRTTQGAAHRIVVGSASRRSSIVSLGGTVSFLGLSRVGIHEGLRTPETMPSSGLEALA